MAENIGIRLSLSGAQAVQSGLSGVNKELGTLQGGALKVADALRGVGAALIAGLSVGAIAAFTRQTINALDAFNDLADATGSSIESLSRLEAVALRTGGNFDQVATALVKLNQQLSAAKPDNEAGLALKMIGLEAQNLRRLDPADALREVAVALAQFESDGAKARIVQELFGKSIREVAPLLNDLAQAGEVAATVTAKQAEEAEKFNQGLAKLSANLTQTARSITSDFLPAINGLLERVNSLDDNKLQRFIDRMMTLGSPAFAVIMRQLTGATASIANQVAAATGASSAAAAATVQPAEVKQRLGSVDEALARNKAAAEAAKAALKAYQEELELYAKRALKSMEAVDQAEEAANKALAEDARQLAANYQRRVEAIDEAEAAADKSLKTAREMVDAILRETEQLQMSNREREIAVALLELERSGLEKGTYAYDEYAKKVREAVIGRENVRESIERQREIAVEYQRMSEQVGQSLSNALMDGGRNAADYIKGLFRTMVLRPVIQAVVGTALGMAPSGMGGGGPGSTLSSLSALNTAYTAITRGFASVGATVSEALLRAGDYLATSGDNVLAASGEWLQGVSQGAGTLAASIAGAAAGYFAKNAISRGFSVSRGMDTVQNIAIAVGSYINPVLGAVVGAVSGLINRAFGRRLRDSGIRGTFGGEAGFTGENYRFYEGGWFRSDRTTTSELDAGTQRGLANAFRELQLNMAQMAAILNRNTIGDLVSFTREFQVSLQGLTDEQAAKALQDELTAVAEALAEAALGTAEFRREGETAVAALERLSRSLLSVNAIFDTLGLRAYAASIEGADLASRLADAAGGLQNLSSITTAYYETFYSEAERSATTTRQVGEAMRNLGLQMPTTREGFRALVEAQDLATQAGQATFVALLNLAPAFASVTQEAVGASEAVSNLADALSAASEAEASRLTAGTDAALNAANDAIAAARESAAQAIRAQFEAQQAVLEGQVKTAQLARDTAREQVQSIRRVFDTVLGAADDLREAAGLGMTAAAGREFLRRAAGTARATGYLPDSGQLSQAIAAARSGLDPNRFSSAIDFQIAQRQLLITLDDLGAATGEQLDQAQAQLEAQEASLEALQNLLSQNKQQFDDAMATNEAFYAAQLGLAAEQVRELRGLGVTVLTLSQAMSALGAAVAAEGAARGAAQASGLLGATPELLAARFRSEVLSGSTTDAQFVAAARAAGVSDAQLRAAAGLLGMPGYASGAAFEYGVVQRPSAFPLGLMGEAGPEAIMPLSRGPGGQLGVASWGSAQLIEEIQALRSEVEGLRAEARATASHTAKTARILDRVTPDGASLQTVAAS